MRSESSAILRVWLGLGPTTRYERKEGNKRRRCKPTIGIAGGIGPCMNVQKNAWSELFVYILPLLENYTIWFSILVLVPVNIWFTPSNVYPTPGLLFWSEQILFVLCGGFCFIFCYLFNENNRSVIEKVGTCRHPMSQLVTFSNCSAYNCCCSEFSHFSYGNFEVIDMKGAIWLIS